METVTIELPPTMKEFVEGEAATAGLNGPGEFIRHLIVQEQKRKAVEELERMAEEAIASGPATPWTEEDVKDLRRRLVEKHGKGTGTATCP